MKQYDKIPSVENVNENPSNTFEELVNPIPTYEEGERTSKLKRNYNPIEVHTKEEADSWNLSHPHLPVEIVPAPLESSHPKSEFFKRDISEISETLSYGIDVEDKQAQS